MSEARGMYLCTSRVFRPEGSQSHTFVLIAIFRDGHQEWRGAWLALTGESSLAAMSHSGVLSRPTICRMEKHEETWREACYSNTVTGMQPFGLAPSVAQENTSVRSSQNLTSCVLVSRPGKRELYASITVYPDHM
jgi:hypothetical protein